MVTNFGLGLGLGLKALASACSRRTSSQEETDQSVCTLLCRLYRINSPVSASDSFLTLALYKFIYLLTYL